MLAISFAAWFEPGTAISDSPEIAVVRGVGAVTLLAGLILIGASSALLGRARAFTALPHPLATGVLVEAGPYRVIRHPIYAGLLLAGAGLALLRVSIAVGLLTLALAALLDVKRRREEAWLASRYPGYAAYRSRTKAWLPLVY